MTKPKKKFVNVTPLSKIANDRFIHFMNRFHACEVIKETGNMIFLVSLNKEYSFWIQKNGNEHWKVEN